MPTKSYLPIPFSTSGGSVHSGRSCMVMNIPRLSTTDCSQPFTNSFVDRSMPGKINLFWLRRDLRLHDNHGLFQALSSGLPVLPIFIFDRDILDELTDRN